MASEGKGTDPAWIYADRIPGNKNGFTCKFCDQTFNSGGISRFKYHLIGYDPHKSVRKCSKVPEDVKREVTRWVRAKEDVKQRKKELETDIRDELRSDYFQPNTNEEEEDDDEDEDDDGYAYPQDMHPSERRQFREAIRKSTAERDKSDSYPVFARGSRSQRVGSSSQSTQNMNCPQSSSGSQPTPMNRSQSSRMPHTFPYPAEPMPSQDTRAKQRTLKGMLKGGREKLGKAISKFFIYDAVPAHKAKSPHFKNMIVEAQRGGIFIFWVSI